MNEKSFLLVSLKEGRSKKLAQVISNDTSRKILDFLAGNEGVTETEISKKLDVPLSTVHYNLQHLLESKLVEADEFHYSEKGKEVLHFRLSNKFIIIAPSEDESVLSKLKKFLPIVAVVGAVSLVMHIIPKLFLSGASFAAKQAVTVGGSRAAENLVADAAVGTAAPAATETVSHVVQQPWFQSNFALWFLYGGLFVVALFFVWELIKARK